MDRQEEILSALTELGNTSQDIAQNLHNVRQQSTITLSTEHPLESWLTWRLSAKTVVMDKNMIEVDGFTLSPPPEPVSAFLYDFERGVYPELAQPESG